jgi:hypothetical protein
MAIALPIILAAGAAVLFLGKKKKKKKAPVGVEPEDGPGAGWSEPGFTIGGATLAAPVDPGRMEKDLEEAVKELPARMKKDPKQLMDEAVDDHDKEGNKKKEKKRRAKRPSERKCKVRTISSDKKFICWGTQRRSGLAKGTDWEVRMRRVPKYKNARNAAAGVSFTGGPGSPALIDSRIAFKVFCWGHRKSLYYKPCIKRWKVGKKRCRRYGKWRRH